MDNILETIKRHPVPAALTALGAAWLLTSMNRDNDSRDDELDWDDGGEFDPAHDSMSDGPDAAGAALGSRAQRLREAASVSVHEAGERARAGISEVQSKVAQTADAVEAQLAEGADRLRHRGERLARRAAVARGRAARQADHLQRKGRETGESIDQAMREQPVVFGALGLVLGAVVGALLPPTRVEDEWLGPHRDHLREAARQELHERTEHAREQIRAGIDDLTQPTRSKVG